MGKQLIKTRLCKHFLRGYCRYEGKCAYAHEITELVPRPDLAKTQVCASFFEGLCARRNCTYAHSLSELRPVSTTAPHEITSSVRLDSLWDRSPEDEPATREDNLLMQELLTVVVQLLGGEKKPDSQAVVVRWRSLVQNLWECSRRCASLEGKCLLTNNRKAELTVAEEQTVVFIFMRDPSWMTLFPRLASTSRSRLASSLQIQLRASTMNK